MKHAALIFNPASGQRPGRRQAQLDGAAALLRAAGVETRLLATPAAGAAGELAARAIESGADAVFACGGDGTVHEVLQGVVGSHATLGVIPLGTANSLAWDLRVPRNPVKAARAALRGEELRVRVGSVCCQGEEGRQSRYFIMNVGIGMDALLFYRLDAALKRRFGMSAYYSEAFRQWATARYVPFEAEFGASPNLQRERVTQALAVRIADFGGFVGRLAPGADLRRDCLRLLMFRTARRLDYLSYVTRTILRRRWSVQGVFAADAQELHCRALDVSGGQRIYVEADGELLGRIPAEVSMASESVTVLAPLTRRRPPVAGHQPEMPGPASHGA